MVLLNHDKTEVLWCIMFCMSSTLDPNLAFPYRQPCKVSNFVSLVCNFIEESTVERSHHEVSRDHIVATCQSPCVLSDHFLRKTPSLRQIRIVCGVPLLTLVLTLLVRSAKVNYMRFCSCWRLCARFAQIAVPAFGTGGYVPVPWVPD